MIYVHDGVKPGDLLRDCCAYPCRENVWLYQEEPGSRPPCSASDSPPVKHTDMCISVGNEKCQQKGGEKMKRSTKERLSDSLKYFRIKEVGRMPVWGVLLLCPPSVCVLLQLFLPHCDWLSVFVFLLRSAPLPVALFSVHIDLPGCHLPLNICVWILQSCHPRLSPLTTWTSTLRPRSMTRSTLAFREQRSSWRFDTAIAWRGWVSKSLNFKSEICLRTQETISEDRLLITTTSFYTFTWTVCNQFRVHTFLFLKLKHAQK